MQKYTLIGYPLGHSMSPMIHERLFAAKNREASYDLTEISPEELSAKAQALKESAKNCLNNENGDFYISEGVKVIIAVILGSLLITAMVALFNSQIIPGIQDKITELFGAYSGPTIVDPSVGGYGA